MNEKKRHNRRSIRLKGYDYSQPGFYFVTICTHRREYVFGDIEQGIMRLNEFGIIARDEWINTPNVRDNVVSHAFVVMPNHIHGIVQFVDSVGAYRDTPQQHDISKRANGDSVLRSPSNNLGAMVRGYKSAVTKRINRIRNSPEVSVWQRNYYEHIIRNQQSLEQITLYIWNNPSQWNQDRFYTKRER